MAFWDFIKQLRLNDEEEKKRREQGGVTNRVFGFLDDTLDTTGDVGKWGVERAKDVVGTAAGLGREFIVKPAVTTIASAEEKQQDYKKDSQVEVINKLKEMKPDEREEYIKSNPVLSNRYKDGKLKFTDTTAPWLFGNIFKGADTMAEVDVKDNEQLNQLIAKINERDTANDKGRQSTNFIDRQVFGNEPIQAYQNRYSGLKDEAGWSTPMAVLGTGANALLDSPLSGGTGSVIKNIGKEGLEKLAKTSAVEGVESILKGNLKDEVIKKVAPLIAEATDVNQIKKLLGDVDPSIAKRIVTGKTKTEAVDEAVGSFRRGIDDVTPPIGKTEGVAPKSTDRIFTTEAGDSISDMPTEIIKTDGGYIRILPNSPYAPENLTSIVKVMVDEGSRRQGIGSDLLKQAMNKYGRLSAFAENEASVRMNYKLGMRPVDNPTATLAETLELSKPQNGALTMITPKSSQAGKSTPIEKTPPSNVANKYLPNQLKTDVPPTKTTKYTSGSKELADTLNTDLSGKNVVITTDAGNVSGKVVKNYPSRITTSEQTWSIGGKTQTETLHHNNDSSIILELPDGSRTAIKGRMVNGLEVQSAPIGKTDPLDTATDAAAQTQKAIDERKLAEGQSAMDSMETVTPPTQPPTSPIQVPQTGSAGDELLSRMYSTSDIDAKMKKKTWRQKLNERWFDKTAAYNRFSSLYKEKTGDDLAKDLDPAVLAQRTNGRERAASMRLEPVIKQIRDSGDFDAVRKLGVARQIMDRADKMPAETVALARRTIDELQSSLGADGVQRVDNAVKSVNDFYDKQLQDLVAIGRLSEDSYNYIRQANPNYFGKVSLIEHILESGDTSRFAAKASHNQAKENIIQAVKGIGNDSRFHIQDPIEMMARSAIAVQKAVEDTQLFKAIQNFEEIDPNSFKTIRASENVIKRMGLSLENKELRPIRDKAERMIKTREKWAKQLQSQINKLEKQGLHKALKGDGTKPMPEFSVKGLGGNAPTSKAADQLGPQDTARFVKSLVEGPNSEIKRLKKMVGTRDTHLAKTLDEIDSLNQEYFEAAQKIASNSEEARALMDLEVPKGLKVISAIQNGVVERVAVPEEVYEAFTGLNAAQKDVVSGTIRKINKVAKEAFTTYNPAFALITNPIRDIGNSAFTSKEVPVKDYVLVLPYAKRWVQSFWGSLVNDEAAQRLARAGAGNAGQFTYDLNPEKFSKELRRKTNGVEVKNPKDFMKEVGRLAGMPGRGIKLLGTAVENATRGVEGRAALKRGASDIEAAVAARRVSTDFAQGGKDAQAINNYLNFFNARLQGTRNIVKGIKDNPKRAGVLVTAGVMMPAAATYLYNETNHPEVMDQIDQQTKDNNWIFVVGDGVDEDGRPNQFITVPKNDAQKIFSVPIENALKALKNDYPDSFAQIATKMLGSVSPVDFQKDGQLNASRTLGGLLPAPISAGVQAVTNKNLYFDSKIVPDSLSKLPAEQQYSDKTPGIDKFIAAALPGEQSPMKVTTVRRGLTGRSADNPIETMKGPLTASGGAVQSEFYKLKSKADKNRASASKYINEAIAAGDLNAASETAEAYNQYVKELYTPFGERYGDYMTEELDSIYQDLKINLNKRSIAARRRTLEMVAQ